MVLESILLGIFILPLREDESPPIAWTMMFMFQHVFINSEDLSSDPYSSIHMNATFLSWFLNAVTINMRMSRGGRLLLDVNPKGHELSEYISTKVEVNPRMLSTLKIKQSIWIMSPGGNFEVSVVGPLGILFALLKRKICRGSYKSGRFVGIPSMSPIPAICFSLVINKWPKWW